MLGELPKSLNVNETKYDIRSDFRIGLLILQAFQDPDLTKDEAGMVMLQCLYKDFESIPIEDIEEAYKQAVWFLNCGEYDENNQYVPPTRKIYDFEQDSQIIFSSINKVAGYEVRALDYLHFWTFIGYFNEIGQGTFSTVVSIRDKKRRGKKLDDWEKKFYKENKSMVDLKRRYTEAELKEVEELNDLLG